MYGGTVYAGQPYAGGGMVAADIPVDVEPTFSVEVAFTTDALATPAWVDISHDVRSWDVNRGRTRELERFQPGRCTVILDNSDREYDSQHATGPYFGNLRPMRRIRIRETFQGVTNPTFDGFVDRWNLDYPEGGQDAIATVTATDGFKIFNRTDLGKSVYANTVEDDSPAIWWRLDDNQVQQGDVAAAALNSGTLGTAANGTYVGPPTLGAQSLIVHDPGSAMEVTDSAQSPGTGDMGVLIDDAAFDLSDFGSWAIEAWVRPGQQDALPHFVFTYGEGGASGPLAFILYDSIGGGRFAGFFENSAGTGHTSVAPGVHPAHRNYHVVLKHTNNVLTMYVNAVPDATPTATAGTLTVNRDLRVGYAPADPADNWVGAIDEFAVYTSALAVDPLTDAKITAHHAAGTSPWQGDTPKVRAGRVLDLADWPADLRELDTGQTTFQSASLQTTALEHLQKTAETEAGSLFMNRAGSVRLIGLAALVAQTSKATFGDLAPEIGYRSVTFDDGDQTLRNRATISRLNGVAKTDEDAPSVAEFRTFQFTLDGLFHNTEAYSQGYADFVVANYLEPSRRVVALELGPAAAGNETALYEQMLGRELGDMITVKVRHPDGTGVMFQQDVVIEGMSDRWDPHGFRTATWTLSQQPGGVPWG